jgi:hypothetical protein
MTEITNCYKNKIKMGAQQSYKNLTMFPLLTSYSISGNNLTMIEPLSKFNTEPNRSTYDTIRYHGHDRITASWDYIEQFARVEGQIGAIFLINGKLAGMVCFQSTEGFKKSFIKIVECYAKKADVEYDSTMDMISSKSDIRDGLKAPFASCIEIQSTAGIEPGSCL